ncbi:pentapeptide repeat-containing protein [Undibacterium sp. TS12]|uniref:pentapeptide repeat-containing protein n=1 Tax=Undibacterium sp. TS12 TaxID=2908202 RepID=UPI001F4CA8A1|nr:pentapeptide repeat-containing protein [Undibacterium sp. TS12]MCH8623108.1 pentapeptide repeat-containing protein [Undibacterium sp. TS12]
MAQIISRLAEPDEWQLKLLGIVEQHGIQCWEIVYYADWEIYDVHFNNVTYDKISFWRCVLKRCSFADFSPAFHYFKLSNLIDVTFSKAGLEEIIFSRTSFKNVNFDNARLFKVKFGDCLFDSISFVNAKFIGTSFSGCDLRQINFDNVEMEDTRFGNCLLSDNLINHPRGYWEDTEKKTVFIVR